MTLPVYQKGWDFTSLNNRISFVSLNDTMGRWLFGQKNYMVATRGVTVQFSCDGTTGPTNSSDHTDRWTDQTKAETRATVAAAAQSYIVLNVMGGQLMFTYQGASDDIARISFSPGSNFVLAGTTTNQPTATDEEVLLATTSLINATTSADRVWSIVMSTDNTVLRQVLCRQGVIVLAWGIEQVNPAPGISSTQVVGFSNAGVYNNIFTTGGAAGGPGAVNAIGSYITRIASTNIQPCGGAVAWNASASANSFAANPELNGGCPVFPLFWGSTTVSNTGWIGTRWDCYIAYSASGAIVIGNVLDDVVQATRVMCIGSAGLWPWDPTKGLVTS